MSAWKRLYEYAQMLSETRQFHGKSAIRLKDLQKLGDEIGVPLDPKGGTVRTDFSFNPSIWKPWYPDSGPALAIASTDDKRDVQSGNPQGGTVHKKNWGGKVVNVAAPIRPHANDRMGSTMDRYDVLLIADIEEKFNAKGAVVPVAKLTRVCWAPSFGNADERRHRLELLATGKPLPPMAQRPQGEVPGISKDDEERWAAQAARRQAADSAASEPSIAGVDNTSGGSANNHAFGDKMAKHNARFQPGPQRKHVVPDPEDALFWTPKDKK